MASVIRLLGILLEKYGMDVAQIAIILGLFWKLFYNHLNHITASLKANNDEIKGVKTEVIDLKERVSNVEGRLEVRKRSLVKKRRKR